MSQCWILTNCVLLWNEWILNSPFLIAFENLTWIFSQHLKINIPKNEHIIFFLKPIASPIFLASHNGTTRYPGHQPLRLSPLQPVHLPFPLPLPCSVICFLLPRLMQPSPNDISVIVHPTQLCKISVSHSVTLHEIQLSPLFVQNLFSILCSNPDSSLPTGYPYHFDILEGLKD
jgi:hypothetical protein